MNFQLKIGSTIDSPHNTYVVESVLGHGTFGITYTIRCIKGKNKGKVFALKEFFINGISSREESGVVSSDSNTISTEQCKAEFIAEAKNLIALNHPNIVKAYEVFETNGTVYYTMDYIEGENLNSYLKHKKLSIDETVKIITKIAYGLSYMHESQHMLHLDLKPGNVMRRASDGQIILIDFGLSRNFNEDDMPDGDSPIGLGTRGYATIEQANFKNRAGNFKATIDVYALGATFYKLVTGETPMPAKELAENLHLLTHKLQTCGLPTEKIKIIEKAMNKDADKRYPSVMSFIYDINSEERNRRKKGCLISTLIMLGVIIIGVVVYNIVQTHKVAKQTYFNELDGYAFELIEPNQGANHYGEIEHYKFFSNGKGFYMFESWHDVQNCYELDCDLEARCDTTTFSYEVVDNSIYFNRDFTTGLSSGGTPIELIININDFGKEIYIGEEYYPLQVVEETINWDETEKIVSHNFHH